MIDRPKAGVCDGCASCCRGLIITAMYSDVLREPAIETEATCCDGDGKLEPEKREWVLAPQTKNGVTSKACPFVHPQGWGCVTYPTRPRICVTFPPASSICTRVRLRDGIGPVPGAMPAE